MSRDNGRTVRHVAELSVTFQHGCVTKQRFTSKHRANGEIRVMHQRGAFGREGKILNVYKCRHCGGWHVGNTTPRRDA